MFQIDLQTQIPPLSNTGKQQIQEGPEWSILHWKSLIESMQVFIYRCHCRWKSNYQEGEDSDRNNRVKPRHIVVPDPGHDLDFQRQTCFDWSIDIYNRKYNFNCPHGIIYIY